MRGWPLLAALALHLLHRGFKHGGVEFESNSLDVPALLAAQHVTCAAQFEIECRNFESRAEVAELFECCQAPARNVGQLVLRWDQKVRISTAIGAANPPAQLVKLAQAVAIGAIDQHGIRKRDVETVFDNRRRNQHIVFMPHEGEHHALKLRLAHLAVAHSHTRRGHKLLNPRGDFVD